MKKLNAKGFTLIELLAVITIMGILMLVAIPAVSRTIENSRKDTFIDTVNSYVNGAKNMWAADNLICKTAGQGGSTTDFVSSAVPNGTYYINVSTVASDNAPQLLEQGGKSSWGSRDIKGYIVVKVTTEAGTAGDTRKVTYYPVLTDGVHGVNVTAATTDTGASTPIADASLAEASTLKRGSIVMEKAGYFALKATGTTGLCIEN